MEKLLAVLESCAMQVVMSHHEDVQALGSLHTQLEEVQGLAQEAGIPQAEEASKVAADTCVELVMGTAADGQAAYKKISETISRLQQIVRAKMDGLDPDSVALPPDDTAEPRERGSSGQSDEIVPDSEILDEFLSFRGYSCDRDRGRRQQDGRSSHAAA